MLTMSTLRLRNKDARVLVVGSLAILTFLSVSMNEISAPLLYRSLRGQAALTKIFVPSHLSLKSQRTLSQNLGGGQCKWQPPVYDVPDELDFHKTLIAGFPSGDKRMIFVQMEALTGWPAKDEWDFEFLGDSNHPFIKANYPHHEGIWGWGTNADQVVMMIRNIRRSMVEYHDILWDIDYAKTWELDTDALNNLYGERPPISDFYEWRDERVMDEAHWYSWFIDYWMEGGLMRDIFTHQITTPEHWNMLMMPTVYTRAELEYGLVVGNDTIVTPAYDPHCTNGEISNGCEPVKVISAEKLTDPTEGKAETASIANALLTDTRTGQYVIAQEAWDCIWSELIQNGKGLKTVFDRPGLAENDYNFSTEMLEGMIVQLDRIIAKYSGPQWTDNASADRVVELITEHRELIQIELDEAPASGGDRALRDKDFLGPKERERRRAEYVATLLARHGNHRETAVVVEKKDHSQYFRAVEQKLMEGKRRKKRNLARKYASPSNQAT